MFASSSTTFSSGLANTFPFVSHAIQVGISEGNTNIMGPTTSFVASAVTQLSSPAGTSSACFEAVRSLEVEESPNLSSTSMRFRFLGFLSPLNVRSFPIAEEFLSVIVIVKSLERVPRAFFSMLIDLKSSVAPLDRTSYRGEIPERLASPH